MLISERHIFFEFLQFSWSKFFLTVVFEYAKNQKNSGHSVVSSISATYGKVAAKFSKNNLSLIHTYLEVAGVTKKITNSFNAFSIE